MDQDRLSEGYWSALPGLAPGAEPKAPDELVIEVDGETFGLRPDESRGTHYSWLSGPNEGYGFTVSPTVGQSLEEHRECIRGFLAQIDPATGFIGDD
ncbi:hypothetical protein ACVW00_000189 [Marmoricola sp. URHA0025 HA25]